MRICKCVKCGNEFSENDFNPAVHYSNPATICDHCRIIESKAVGEWYQDRNGEYTQKLPVSEIPKGHITVPAELIAHARWMLKELEGWKADQGSYGTTGYDEILPEIKAMIEGVNKDEK